MKKIIILLLILLCGCGVDEQPRTTKAVIVPHHDIALGMAEEVISPLADINPKTIILVGPNHTANGPKITSTSDGAKISRLIGANDVLIENEHSVGNLMPLVKKYFPDANVIPIIFQKGVPFDNAKKVMEAAFFQPDVIVIASIDFSHGLSSQEEKMRRGKMEEYIKGFDSAAIMGLDETYLDAPVVLAALLEVLKENVVHNADIIAGANASDILGAEVPDATGYLTVTLY